MQADIHPQYELTTVVCSCGNTFTTRSTKAGTIHVELCNECHPFFTGKQKLVDSGGRVERFQRRYGQRKGATAKKGRRTRSAGRRCSASSSDPSSATTPAAVPS